MHRFPNLDSYSLDSVCAFLTVSDCVQLSYCHRHMQSEVQKCAVRRFPFNPMSLGYLPLRLLPQVRLYAHIPVYKKMKMNEDESFPVTPSFAPLNVKWLLYTKDNKSGDVTYRLAFPARSSLPPNLLEFEYHESFWGDDAQSMYLPPSIRKLHLVLDIDKYDFAPGFLPSNLEELTLEEDKALVLRPGILPSTLAALTIGWFDTPLLPLQLPPSLTLLQVACWYGTAETKDIFPSTLKTLHIYGEFSPELVPGLLPSGLTELAMSYYNRRLHPGSLPAGLLDLDFPGYNQPLEKGVLPEGLKHLSLWSYEYPVDKSVLPKGLISAYFLGTEVVLGVDKT